MVQVMHHSDLVMFFVEGLPNHGQEFISLNQFLQESSRASIEDTFLTCSPVTPGQDDYRGGRELEVRFQHLQNNEPIPGW
jgi:hypothetical protein